MLCRILSMVVKVKVKLDQSCATLCKPMDYTVHGTLQARILEWAAILFSGGSSQPRDRTQVSRTAAEPQEKGTIIHGWSVGFREKFVACKAIRRW